MDAATARRIRFLRATQGTPTKVLAQMFNIGPETVRRCLRWETHRQVGEEGPGAQPADWAASRPPASEAEIAASQARLLGSLQADVAAHHRGDVLLDELAGHGNGAVVGSGNGATSPQTTDGGTK